MTRPTLRLGHSPDPDDAFMWWPLLEIDGAAPRIDTGRFRFEAVPADIEALNERAHEADLEITALSCAHYPHVCDRYALTACGASMGDRYGPKLVSREPMDLETLRSRTAGPAGGVVAVPGRRTTAFAVTSLMLGPGAFRYEEVPFDAIIDRVASGGFEAGVVIHEGQLTYEEAGLRLVEDVGAWWWRRHDRPLPLGVNAIRRDLEQTHGTGVLEEITGTLLRSVRYALDHRDESIRYALGFARSMAADRADEFVRMYVNRWTLDFGESGRVAVRVFLEALHEAGLAPSAGAVDFIAAAV